LLTSSRPAVSALHQQRLNPPSLGDRIPGEQAMLACIPVCFGRAGSVRATVHAAARLPFTAGERHAPPERVLALQRGLASIGPAFLM